MKHCYFIAGIYAPDKQDINFNKSGLEQATGFNV